MKNIRILYCLTLTALLSAAGCIGPKSPPNPLVGWQVLRPEHGEKLDRRIIDDYRDYIQKNLTGKGYFIDENAIWFLKDGTGQHAVTIEIPSNGVWLEHVLIYDKENNRVKVIKYANGRYRS